jgi:carbon-monoxide dehydrogenase medium subunit
VTGASEDGVFRWAEAEEALNKSFSAEALMGLSVNPMNMIADLHGSKTYRAHLVGVMTKRAVQDCS